MDYNEWASRWPQAAAEFEWMMAVDEPAPGAKTGPEARAQQEIRMAIAKAGGLAWRNNVGATPAKRFYTCAHCGFTGAVSSQPVRYGICNDSPKLNAVMKSSDLVGVVPITITPDMVGSTVGQAGFWECKRPGWQFNPNDAHSLAQANFISLVQRYGARAMFTTGANRI